MSAEEKIAALIAAEDRRSAEMSQQYHTSKTRVVAFEAVRGTLANDNSSGIGAVQKAIEAKINRENAMMASLRPAIEESKIRRSALEETLKLFEKIPADQVEKDLRSSSELYTVREFIRKKGHPVSLEEIVADGLGYKEILAEGFDAKYASLRGTINGYAKENRIFTIESKPPETDSHIIGLIEFKEKVSIAAPQKVVVPKRPSPPPTKPRFYGGGEAVPIS